jgi:triosephosphate isomerase (TIM)
METEQAKRLFVGGNWKSNNTLAQTEDLVKALNTYKFDTSKVEVVVAPISLHAPFVLANIS